MRVMPRQIWNHDQIGHENGVVGAPTWHGAEGKPDAGDVLLGYGTDIEPVMEMGFWVPQRGTAYQPRVQPWDQKTQCLAF
jgi:hypothetical protein